MGPMGAAGWNRRDGRARNRSTGHADLSTQDSGPSIVSGIPLSEEPGLGVLTIPGYAREITSRFADREALVSGTDRDAAPWTYATLWERSLEVARALVAAGVEKNGRVGILMTNRPEFLAALFGTSLAGGVAALLDTFATQSELEHLIEASSISILLFERSVAGKDFAAMLGEADPAIPAAEPGRLLSTRFPYLRHLAMIDTEAEAAGKGAIETWSRFLRHGDATPPVVVEKRAAGVTPADAAAIFFSSGTTGAPKGILHSQRAIAIQWWRMSRLMEVGGEIRGWTPNGFFWSGNLSVVIGTTFTGGGTIVLQAIFDAEETLELLQRERVTFGVAWPHQWAALEQAPNWSGADLGTLRYVNPAYAPHPTRPKDWQPPAPFGASETLTFVTCFPASTPPEKVAGSFGEALPGNTLKIVDPLTGVAVPRGERGEICVKGPTLMLGYLGVPADETLDAEGFFHTGDGGYLDDEGRLFWEGRLSHIIKTGGANVSPPEVDAVLADCPAVKLVTTVGVPHETLGEMVVSCIVPHEGVGVAESEIRAFARERLASYKVPRRILFFDEDELAKTGSQKVKADALRELAVERLNAQPDTD
jgi:fatty-acyl-CoA synthase